MYATGQGHDSDLLGRLDDLEGRITFLESVVLEDSVALEDPADEPLARRPNTDAATNEIGAARVQDSSARWDPGRAIDDLGPDSSEAPTLAAPDVTPALDDDPTTVGWAAYAAVRRTDAPGERAGGGPVLDLAALEERLAGRALALMGGVALILGAVFFLSLAFSRG